jgi:starvation-inducible outer membrane lipoprotein
MQTIRFCFDKMMRAGIKLAMLTGVAFTVTACYGVPPERREWHDDQAYQTDTQQVEQQLVAEQEETE